MTINFHLLYFLITSTQFLLFHPPKHILTKKRKREQTFWWNYWLNFLFIDKNNHSRIYFSDTTTQPYLGGVMVAVLASGMADREFELGPVKKKTIELVFVTSPPGVKSITGWLVIRIIGLMSPQGLLFL